MEERMAFVDPERGLNYVKRKLTPLIEGARGRRRRLRPHHPRATPTRTPTPPTARSRSSGRAGALYPFFRSSALLRTSTARPATSPWSCSTPASGTGPTGLSFMGMLNPDNDYRPRIYP
jgi:hypothetical protein